MNIPPIPPLADASADQRTGPTWQRSLAEAVRDPATLLDMLNLPTTWLPAALHAAESFRLLVPLSYIQRMQSGDIHDPLLRQVLPIAEELQVVAGFVADPVGDRAARQVPGLLQKYQGRVLLVATGACAVHCRYCFRRHYPYGEEPRRLDDWQPALDAIASDKSIDEVILSGGDPLLLTDSRLEELVGRIEEIPHITRLRLHSRLPIVLPDRVHAGFLQILEQTRLTPIMVVHANHPAEIVGDCSDALHRIVRSGLMTLNQTVLLKGINDDTDTLTELSRRLVDLGVQPYYLHQLDRVAGAAHFEVSPEQGRAIIKELRSRLPGYAVPRYVAEIAGSESKTPLEFL